MSAAAPGSWIDLTHTTRPGMVAWPGDAGPEFRTVCEIGSDCPVRVSLATLTVHNGTHLDAPAHYIEGGALVEDIALDVLVGRAWIADAGDAPVLSAAVLETLALPAGVERLLVRTANTRRDLMNQAVFAEDYVGLDLSGALWLLARGIRLFGVDYLSVQAFTATGEVHVRLLEAKTVLIEALDLSRVAPGWHELVCLPPRWSDVEGAPVRAIARPIH